MAKVYDPILCMMVEDGTRTTDEAIKTMDANTSKIAEYLWSWKDAYANGGGGDAVLRELDNSYNGPKNREAFDDYCRKNYKRILDTLYSSVKSDVSRILEEGYKNIEKRFK